MAYLGIPWSGSGLALQIEPKCASISLPRDVLHYLKIFLIENTHKTRLQKMEISLRISNTFWQSQTELQVIYFHEN